MDKEEKDEDAPQPCLTIPEDLDSGEAMVAFLNVAPASAKEEKTRLCKQLAHCRRMAHLAAPSHSEHTKQALVPRSGDNCVSGETPQAL